MPSPNHADRSASTRHLFHSHTITCFLFLIALASMAFVGCGGGGSSAPPPPPPPTPQNPIPTVASVSPSSVLVGSTPQILTINGSNFLTSSTVTFGNSSHTPTSVSATQLTIQLAASDLSSAGDFQVSVSNPSPGGGTSNAATFAVNNPLPTLATVSPSVIAVGTPALTVSLSGTNFVPTSTVTLNGASLSTEFVSPTGLTASLPAQVFANPGTQNLAVLNPGPGGGTSPSQTITIAAVGAVSVFSFPSTATATTGAWELNAAVVDPNGNPIPNLLVTLQASSGALAASEGMTDSLGSFSTTVAPPADAGPSSATAVSIAAGNHIAVVNLAFAAFPAATAIRAFHRSSQQAQATSTFIQEPMEFGISRAPTDTTNPFVSAPDPCYTPLDLLNAATTTQCAPIFATNNISSAASNFATESCQTVSAVSDLIGLANCAGALATIAVCLDTPAAIICAGELGFLADPTIACISFVASQIATHFHNQAALQLIDAAGIVQDPTDPLGWAGLICDALAPTSSSGPRIYVTNSGNGTVNVFDQNGAPLSSQFNFPGLVAPDGIAYDASTQQLYITDVGDDSIKVYTLDGQRVDTTNLFPTTPGGNPEDILFNPINREFYVNDTNFNSILVFSEQGNPITNLPANAFAGLSGPFGLGFDHATDLIYVSNSNTNQVLVFDQNGVFQNLEFGGLFLPDDITWDPATGNLYVVNDGDSSVSVLDPNGNIVPTPGGFPNLSLPDQIIGDGNFLSPKFYITSIQGNSVRVYDRAGNDLTPANGFQNPNQPLNQPTGVVVVP